MKSSSLIVLAGAVVVVAGIIVYSNRQEAPAISAPATESAPGKPKAQPVRTVVPKEEQSRIASQDEGGPAQVSIVTPVSSEGKPDGAVSPGPPVSPVKQVVDTLVSRQASFQQKHEAWKQLQDAEQLDQAIEALKQGAAENPASAAYPATLGQAQLRKAGVVAQKGGTISEMGILGMQADQSFDQALKLDPANWEAQFFKAAAMSHWPLELNKGEEVIQRLSTLIEQQEAMPPEPQFAQTYILLGDQYQKMGKPDYAAATWQIGARTFSGDPVLQQKTRGN